MYDDSREGELGCLKLETGEKMIVELVALGPKLYSVLLLDNSTKQTAKGIPKRNQRDISHGDYRNALLSGESKSFTFGGIKVVNEHVETVKYTRVGLNAFDSKRYCKDKFTSYFFGDPRIPIIQPEPSSHKPQIKNKRLKRGWEDIDGVDDLQPMFRDRVKIMRTFYPRENE